MNKFIKFIKKGLDCWKYETVEFDEVSYVGYVNDRLILSAKYTIGKANLIEEIFSYNEFNEFSDTIIVYEGEISDGVFHFKEAFSGRKISKDDYEFVRNCIIMESSIWCEKLGLPKITISSIEKWNG